MRRGGVGEEGEGSGEEEGGEEEKSQAVRWSNQDYAQTLVAVTRFALFRRLLK